MFKIIIYSLLSIIGILYVFSSLSNKNNKENGIMPDEPLFI
jgi:hypothetical protein